MILRDHKEAYSLPLSPLCWTLNGEEFHFSDSLAL
jgi:hypothetical protein